MKRSSVRRTLLQVVSAALVGVGLWSSFAHSELEVIYDSGATAPLAPYLEVFAEVPPSGAPDQQAIPGEELGAADPSQLLPIRSPGLSPGPVTARPLKLPNNGTLSRPFFLIGSDEHSRTWLAMHRDRLRTLGAVGMLVQAESAADLKAIAGLAGGLPILPASATDIARILGLRHYPVLISRHGLEQ